MRKVEQHQIVFGCISLSSLYIAGKSYIEYKSITPTTQEEVNLKKGYQSGTIVATFLALNCAMFIPPVPKNPFLRWPIEFVRFGGFVLLWSILG